MSIVQELTLVRNNLDLIATDIEVLDYLEVRRLADRIRHQASKIEAQAFALIEKSGTG